MPSIREAQARAEIKRVDRAKQKADKNLRKFVSKRLPQEARGGKVLPLRIYPSASLKTPCETVESFDSDLTDLIQSMATTMYMCGGVGLAANQVGVLQRVFVCDVRSNKKGDGSEFRTFINPVILDVNGMIRLQEGCLSFPGAREIIERPEEVTFRSQTPNGEPFEAKIVGWEARVFLHEFDHLDGRTWLDQMKPLQRRMVTKKIRKIARNIELDKRGSVKRRKMRTRRR